MKRRITVFPSLFKTDKPTTTTIEEICREIKNGGKNNILINKLRKEKDKDKRNEIKKQLPVIMWSGQFSKRSKQGITSHSGLICLDFDDIPDDEIIETRQKLKNDPYTFILFTSPSNNGLKLVTKIPAEIEKHEAYFNALLDHYFSPYLDISGKDISRCCFLSIDENIYTNENSKIWSKAEIKQQIAPAIQQNTFFPISDEQKKYDIIKRWGSDQYYEGNRDNFIFKLACICNKVGILSTSAEQFITNDRDFTPALTAKEITRCINSAYTKGNRKNDHNTLVLEDRDKINHYANYSNSTRLQAKLVQQENVTPEKAEEIAKFLESYKSESFYYLHQKKVKFHNERLRQFLIANGFYKYYTNESSYIFVKIDSNIVTRVEPIQIKDFVTKYIENLSDFENTTKEEVINSLINNAAKLFSTQVLEYLPTKNINFCQDDEDSCYLFFIDRAIKITADQIESINYGNLPGYIWESQIIERRFKIEKDYNNDFQEFINLTQNLDKERIKAVETIIGFLIHRYKNPELCPAIVLNDEEISVNPEGGTGKGLFTTALSYVRNTAIEDGKAFQFNRAFAYQNVSIDTELLVFDDVKQYFKFGNLFSVITQGITVEKKNQQPIRIPFEESPKVLISTNYVIQGDGNSNYRRRVDVEFGKYFSKEKTPLEHFGHTLFLSWEDDHFNKFYNYLIRCTQNYLDIGLLRPITLNIVEKRLAQKLSEEMLDYFHTLFDNILDSKTKTGEILKSEITKNFNEQYNDKISGKKMLSCLDAYCKAFKILYDKDVVRRIDGKLCRLVCFNASEGQVLQGEETSLNTSKNASEGINEDNSQTVEDFLNEDDLPF